MFNLLADGNTRNAKNSPVARQADNSMPAVLIVEDDADSRLMLRLLLETWRYRALEAADGIEALSLAERETPDLILMDVKMPRLDGFETTRRLRASGKTSEVPIIFLTGCAEETDRRHASAVGATEYMLKPLDFERLETILDNCTGKYNAIPIRKKLKLSESSTISGDAKILQRIARGEQAAVRECVDAYGNVIWALSRKFTGSRAAAEDAASAIFLRIWQCAKRFNPQEMNEIDFIRLIAYRELR